MGSTCAPFRVGDIVIYYANITGHSSTMALRLGQRYRIIDICNYSPSRGLWSIVLADTTYNWHDTRNFQLVEAAQNNENLEVPNAVCSIVKSRPRRKRL